MNQAANIERRKHRRVPLEGITRVRILAPGPKMEGVTTFSIAEGHLCDVTTVGAFVATSLVVERGQRVELEFAAPGMTNPKPVVAVVARCTGRTNGGKGIMPRGLGVRFVTQTDEERDRIREIVMATLTLDLLDYGYERQTIPTTSQTITPSASQAVTPSTGETIVPGAQGHPIQWQPPEAEDLRKSTTLSSADGQTEMTVRLQCGEPSKDSLLADALLDDVDLDMALWNLVG